MCIRDRLVTELSKLIKTTVVPQGQGGYNVFIGNGLPLVVGTTSYNLTTASSPTDPSRLEVAYHSNNKTSILSTESLPGGSIGGLLQFRSESLDAIQNKIGQIAVSIAGTFNAQHAQGTDKNGNPGGNLFTIAAPIVNSNSNNTGSAVISSQVVDVYKRQVVNGALESSNVNVVDAMVTMISLARQFEMQMKLVQSAENNANKASQLLNMSWVRLR